MLIRFGQMTLRTSELLPTMTMANDDDGGGGGGGGGDDDDDDDDDGWLQ